MKKSLIALGVALSSVVSMGASAATTGTINFNGSVINATCQVATASANQTVTLPQVETSHFTAINQAGGKTAPVEILLTGCTGSTPGTVTVGFAATPEPGYDNLIRNTGTASGVGVRLYDAQDKAIGVTGTLANRMVTPALLKSGDIGFNLKADYVSTSSVVMPGSVIATTTFEVVYP